MPGGHAPVSVHVLVVEEETRWLSALRGRMGGSVQRVATLREAVRFALTHPAVEVLLVARELAAPDRPLLEQLRRVRPELPVLALARGEAAWADLVDDFLEDFSEEDVLQAVEALLGSEPYV